MVILIYLTQALILACLSSSFWCNTVVSLIFFHTCAVGLFKLYSIGTGMLKNCFVYSSLQSRFLLFAVIISSIFSYWYVSGGKTYKKHRKTLKTLSILQKALKYPQYFSLGLLKILGQTVFSYTGVNLARGEGGTKPQAFRPILPHSR